MSRELCGYAGQICTQKCYLLESTALQSEAGGFEKKDLTGPSGPIWPRDTWDTFINNTILTAQNEGCLIVGKLESEIPQITQQKDQKGEFT